MKIISLYEGSYSVDSSKKFVPFDPNVDKKSDRPGSLFIHVHPFLLKTEKALIVIDTGLGFTQNGEMSIVHNIRAAGYEPEQVDYVLLSHLHKDHASGMVDENGSLVFPNAQYVIQRQEWEVARKTRSDSYQIDHIEILEDSENLLLVEGNGQLDGFITYEISGGHSEFHQVFWIKDNDTTYFYGGDEWPEPEQILKRFAAKYDYDGRKAMHLRDTYAKQASDEKWICLFYHATKCAIAHIVAKGDSYSIEEVQT